MQKKSRNNKTRKKNTILILTVSYFYPLLILLLLFYFYYYLCTVLVLLKHILFFLHIDFLLVPLFLMFSLIHTTMDCYGGKWNAFCIINDKNSCSETFMLYILHMLFVLCISGCSNAQNTFFQIVICIAQINSIVKLIMKLILK